MEKEVQKVEIMPVDKITQELAAKNITESILKEMEEKFLPLTIEGIDDKVGYEAVHKARIACKNTRILATKICKEGREEAIAVQKQWINKEKEVVARIEAVEQVLEERQKTVDEEKKRLKEVEERQKQERLNDRVNRLLSLGMVYTGTGYQLEELRMGVLELKEANDLEWTAFLASVETRSAALLEAKRIEDEQKAQQAARIKAQAEENARKEAEIKAREEAIFKKEQEMKAAAEALEKAEKEKKEAEARRQEEIREARIKEAKSQLYSIGFAYQGDTFVFNRLKVPLKWVEDNAENKWADSIILLQKEIATIKEEMEAERIAAEKKAEEERIIREEKIRLEAIEAEKKRQAEAAAAEKAKQEALEAERKRLQALAPDADKFASIIHQILAVKWPDFTSVEYQNIGVDAINKLQGWAGYVRKQENTIKNQQTK